MPTVKTWPTTCRPLEELTAEGRVSDGAKLPAEQGPKPRKRPAPELVAPGFIAPATWIIPLVTASEANGREWRKRSKRTDLAWRAVSKALGPHLVSAALAAAPYHRGEPIRVFLTRLGGRLLDRSNLPMALKATEDALAFILGCDDGNPLWQAEWFQKCGGPCGVEVAIGPGTRG